MIQEQLQHLLDNLRKELSDKVDEKTKQDIDDFDTDVNQLLLQEPELPEKELLEEVLASARDMEAKFASDYPTAERLVQEIIYILGRLGI